ncbi:MAG: Rpn family recombination-promoting nuclease/putative transposase [Candidatus Cardinium sp.]
MFGYTVQLMRQHLSEKGNSTLPAIINICVYNGKEPYKGATNLRTIFPELDSIQEYMFQGFHLVDLYSMSDNELSSYNKAACATMVLKQGIHRDFCDWIIKQQKLFVDLEKQGYISYIHEVIWYMLAVDDHKHLLDLINQFHSKLEEVAMSVAEKLRQEGQEKGKLMGIQIGQEKGKLDIAKALLSEGESIERVIRLTGLSRSQLKGLKPTK